MIEEIMSTTPIVFILIILLFGLLVISFALVMHLIDEQ